jgi:hypothetical protein
VDGKQKLCRRLGICPVVLFLSLALGGPVAHAAGPPSIGEVWSSEVSSSSARLIGEINPRGAETLYRFDYISAAAFEANVAAGREAFTGAATAPPGPEAGIGAGSTEVAVDQRVSGLSAETAYRFRLVASSDEGTASSPALAFVTAAVPEAIVPIACEGDSCQILPPEPVDPALTTLIPGPGNPKVRYRKLGHRRRAHRRRHGHHRHRHRHRRGGRR